MTPGLVSAGRVDTIYELSVRDSTGTAGRFSPTLTIRRVLVAQSIEGDPLTGAWKLQALSTEPIDAEALSAELRARLAADPAAPAVLSVHGFGTSPTEALEHAAATVRRGRFAGPWLVFSWPSNGLGVDWSRPWMATGGYREDSLSAVRSAPRFTEALALVAEAVGPARTLVVAHSLGARVVDRSLQQDSARWSAITATGRLRAVAYFAADVERARFRDVTVPATQRVARRTVLYAAADDRLLAVSRQLNGSERVGLIREDGVLVVPGLETVDVTDALTAEGAVQRAVGTHHTLRRASGALFDLLQVVGGQQPATCRARLRTGERTAQGAWRLAPTPPPPPGAAVARCAGPE